MTQIPRDEPRMDTDVVADGLGLRIRPLVLEWSLRLGAWSFPQFPTHPRSALPLLTEERVGVRSGKRGLSRAKSSRIGDSSAPSSTQALPGPVPDSTPQGSDVGAPWDCGAVEEPHSCHPERSEGSSNSRRINIAKILRCAQNDKRRLLQQPHCPPFSAVACVSQQWAGDVGRLRPRAESAIVSREVPLIVRQEVPAEVSPAV